MWDSSRRAIVLTATAVAILAAAAPSPAQIVRGRLTDVSTRVALPAAELTLLGLDNAPLTSVQSDSSGDFVVAAPRAGQYRLRATLPGYRTAVSAPMRLLRNDTVNVEIRLSTQVVLLEAVKVVGVDPRAARRYGAYYSRLATRVSGLFITRQQIAEARPRRATDMLRSLPGVALIPGTGDGYYVRFRGTCDPTLYIDGSRVQMGGLNIDDFVRPNEIEGIEVYRSIAEAPVEYQGMNAGCGAIIVWTKIEL